MYKVNILASENSLFSSVFGPFDMLIQAGVFWNSLQKQQPTPYFDVDISSVEGNEIQGMAGARFSPHRKIKDDDKYDIILIPSEGMNINPASDSFKDRAEYIIKMHNKGAVIASICTGAFLVAFSGLLDKKTATTHWAFEHDFKSQYPDVNIDTKLLIADTGSVITAGGVSADQDLCMHMITRFCGHDIAIQTARCTLVNRTAREQSLYRTFAVERNHGLKDILDCQDFIDNNLSDNISIAGLSKLFSINRRTLSRRFKEATGHSLISYIQQLRVENSKFIIEREDISFDDVARRLGYENTSFFRRLFKQYVGVTPKEYKRAFFRG